MTDFIDTLFGILQDRQTNPKAGSYTNRLLADHDEIVKKIGEEAIEVIIAAQGQGKQRLVEETADLIYHTLVLLIAHDLTWDDVRAELARRHQ